MKNLYRLRKNGKFNSYKCKLISATGHTIHVEDSDEFDTMILGV